MKSFCYLFIYAWLCLTLEPYCFGTVSFAAHADMSKGSAQNKSLDKEKPPIAAKKPVTTTLHGDTRVDNYAWMRDPSWPATVKNKDIRLFDICWSKLSKSFIPLKIED